VKKQKPYAFFVIIFATNAFLSFGQLPNQTSNYRVNWTVDPFDQKAFIENKGQFSEPLPNGDAILYQAIIGRVYAYITRHGILYKYTEIPMRKVENGKDEYPDKDEVKATPIQHYLLATWQGSSDKAIAMASDEQTYYDTYTTKSGGIKANAYKKVTCINVYPGIDIEYLLPDNGGIKYTLIVHPGANASLAQLKYKGAKSLNADATGNIVIETGWGEFTDHAPEVFYADDHKKIDCKYLLNNNTESFKLNNPEAGKTIAIDPWTTMWTQNPGITLPTTSTDATFDVDYDYNGNVYACGSSSKKLVKMNSSGTILWTANNIFAAQYFYGGFCVDRATGSCYITGGETSSISPGAGVIKIDNAGLCTDSLTLTPMIEYWRIKFDQCNDQVIIAGGGPQGHNDVVSFDTNLANVVYSNPFFPSCSLYQDLTGLAIDPSGAFCYMASTTGSEAAHNDHIVQLPLPALTSPLYNVTDNLSLGEFNCNHYANQVIALGMNCLAASLDYVYVYDGIHLNRFNSATGAPALTVTLPGTWTGYWSGLDADISDNVYAGNQKNIFVFDSTLTQTATIGPMADTITDLVLGHNDQGAYNGLLYVCGGSFVSSIKLNSPASHYTITKNRTLTCDCNANATGTLVINSNPVTTNVTYVWSNGQTTQTATGLCPGSTYTLTVGVGCTYHFSDTFNITPGYVTATKSQISATCASPGRIMATANGGLPPYTYLWNNGSTSSSIDNPLNGTYSVRITDHGGCHDTAGFIVSGTEYGNVTAAFSLSPQLTSIAHPAVQFTDHSKDELGIQNWQWNFGISDSASSLQNPVFSYTDTGTFCVTLRVTDNQGCRDSATNCVVVYPDLNLYIPDAFSPNGDGLNDEFAPRGTGLQYYTMNIFDRWGNQVYTTSTSQPWKGSSSGTIVPEGVYLYQIIATDYFNMQHTFVGKVTVLK